MTNKFSIKDLTISKKLSSPELLPIILGLVSGFSVFYYLYFFEAYGIQKGISYSGHSHLFRSISFGVLIFVYLTAFEAWIKPKWASSHIKYEVTWYVGLVILGSQLVFLLFNFFWNWLEWNGEAYVLIIKEFPLMMVLPFSFYLLLKKTISHKNPEVTYLLFQSENGKDQLKIRLQDFLFASSSENYVTISFSLNGQIKEHLIRKPLKVLEQELKPYPEIQKSHRRHVINSNNIQSVKQDKAKVYLRIMGVSLPVSKQYHNLFLS